MKTYLVNFEKLTQLELTKEDIKDGIIIQFDGTLHDDVTVQLPISMAEDPDDYEIVQVEEEYYHVPDHPNCEFGDCNRVCYVADCGINQGYYESPNSIDECVKAIRIVSVKRKKEKVVKDERTEIPGYPGCRVGDCSKCHSVSCQIHQGFEE